MRSDIQSVPSWGRRSSRALFWRTGDGQAALRRGRLKYLRDSDGNQHLFNVVADPSENTDLAMQHPDEMDTLRQRWEGINAELLSYPPE